MNYYFITGASKGIGKAIAEELLKEQDTRVIGISRSHSIEQDGYERTTVDLSDEIDICRFNFPKLEDAARLVLINNAGALGEVNHLGKLNDVTVARALNLNIVAPTILINKFLKTYANSSANKLIINVTSGAATNPYDGWGIYSTSKAGLDMLTRVTATEQEQVKNNPTIVLGVAPGVVDTNMQMEIRGTDESGFSRKQKFLDLKEQDQLYKPADVAKRFVEIIKDPESVDLISRIQL